MRAAQATSRRREEMLVAAGRVFNRRGYAAATMDEVARGAGLAKGSLYNYFAGKHDLFLGVFTQALAGDMAKAEGLLRRRIPALEKIDRLLEDWFKRLGHHRAIGRLVLEFWAAAARQKRRGELARWFRRMYGRWRGQVAEVIAQGVRAGEFGSHVDPTVASSLILAVMDGIILQMILDMRIRVDKEFLAAMKRAIFSGLTAPHPGRSTR